MGENKPQGHLFITHALSLILSLLAFKIVGSKVVQAQQGVLPQHLCLSPLQHKVDPLLSSFLLYRAFLRNGILCINMFLLGTAMSLQCAATELSGIFH